MPVFLPEALLIIQITIMALAATRAGMKEMAVREPPARLAGVDARAPWFFHAEACR
jgi:hypothetical protein